jgi:hypothetical protein
MSLVSGKLMVNHDISEPNGPPGPGRILWFFVHGRKDKILVDQSLIIEYDGSKSNNVFDTIKEVRLEIGGTVIETHTSQLLKDLYLSTKGSAKFIIPLHFFYCRSKTPLVLNALDYNEVRVRVELGNCNVTRCELDSTIVTATSGAICNPDVTKITIITDECPASGYQDFIVVGDNVYYLVGKTVKYHLGTLKCF